MAVTQLHEAVREGDDKRDEGQKEELEEVVVHFSPRGSCRFGDGAVVGRNAPHEVAGLVVVSGD